MVEQEEKRITKTCTECDKVFRLYRPQQKFCGQPCKNRHFNALKKIAWQKFKAEGVGVGQG